MNDETEAANNAEPEPRVNKRSFWVEALDQILGKGQSTGERVVRGLVAVNAIVVIVYMVVMLSRPVPEGTHCSAAEGNATCVEYYGGNRPYCVVPKRNVHEHGCEVNPPPRELAKPCGQRKQGPPDDPTCSQVLVDNPPDPEFLKKVKRRNMLHYVVVLGPSGLVIVGIILVNVFARRRERAQAQRERRAQQAANLVLEQTRATNNRQEQHSASETKKSQR